VRGQSKIKIIKSNIAALEVLQFFSDHDDYMIGFLGADSVYYTRYSAAENIHDVWVAYSDGTPVGCAAYREYSPGIGEVKRLFIESEYRGHGISKSLLATVEDHARRQGCQTLRCDTRVTLEPAVTLYRHFGFVEIFRDGLYVVMEKKL